MAVAKILVAEDDAILQSLFEKKFTMNNFAVRTASDGRKAIEMIREERPDLLLLDIRMPVMDGLQVLGEYPKNKRNFPIIILTNVEDDETKLRALELGADDYFVKKNMTIKTLLEMARHILKLK
jgi:DNA-binding response OmpR family regulator